MRRVFACMMAQGGKTALAMNVIGMIMDDRPRPVLYVAATKDQIVQTIEPKIDHMLRNCASLWAKTTKGQRYTKAIKVISGQVLRLAWPTPSQMSGDTFGAVVVDEIDRIDRDVGRQGSIIEQADARHSQYPDGKTLGISSPTEGNIETEVDARTGLERWRVSEPEDVVSQIWGYWQMGTRHEWAWPCPQCRAYFVPRFKWLRFDSKASYQAIRRDARLQCPHCEAQIANDAKRWMNARGVYLAPGQRPRKHRRNATCALVDDYTGAKRTVHRVEFGSYALPVNFGDEDATFWVSGVANFASQRSFGAVAVAHVKAARSGDIETIKGVINLQHGECFRFGGDAPAWSEVAARKADYSSGAVPDWVRVLFLTVDVQANRLEYVVRGWGANQESALVEAGELWGDTDRQGVWDDLHDLRARSFGGLRISRTAIDAGYRPNPVYTFCHAHRGSYATKGGAYEKLFAAAKVEVDRRGRLKKSSFILWHVDHDKTKQWVHSRMGLEPEQAGQWHLPGDVDEDYCRQIGNEQRIRAASGKYVWRVTGANHKLDCEALQYFVAMKDARLIRRVAPLSARAARAALEAESDTSPTPPPARRAPRRRRGFVGGFST